MSMLDLWTILYKNKICVKLKSSKAPDPGNIPSEVIKLVTLKNLHLFYRSIVNYADSTTLRLNGIRLNSFF